MNGLQAKLVSLYMRSHMEKSSTSADVVRKPQYSIIASSPPASRHPQIGPNMYRSFE